MAKQQQADVPPITRADFKQHARPVPIKLNDETKVLNPKEYDTGSLGWYMNEKLVVTINGVPVRVQAQIMLTVVGSKALPYPAAD